MFAEQLKPSNLAEDTVMFITIAQSIDPNYLGQLETATGTATSVEAKTNGCRWREGKMKRTATTYRHAQDLDIFLARHFDFLVKDDSEKKRMEWRWGFQTLKEMEEMQEVARNNFCEPGRLGGKREKNSHRAPEETSF